MSTQSHPAKNRINTVLILLVLVNVIGDLGNIAFWYASPSSQDSLKGGYIAAVAGEANALIAGTAILLVVALIYIASAYGLLKKQTWAPLLVIAISVANRTLAAFLYLFSEAFFFWLVWTIILVVVASLDYRKLAKKTA